MNKSINLIIILIAFFCIQSTAIAKNYAIRGFVTDATSGEPLLVASLMIENTMRGASTNLDGYFVINYVELGSYTLIASYLGYETRSIDIVVTHELMEPMNIELNPTAVKLETAEVVLDREEQKETRKRPRVSTVPVSAQVIRTMPSLGGEMDVMRALQTIPGIKASSDISSALHIRGGSPDQTLILMDHNTVYNPNHMFGLFSTFNTDAVKHLELIKGGFPAQYGGRSGSVLDIVMNDGNRKKYEGLTSLGIVSARASIEGPLSFAKGSFAASYRRTYLDWIIDVARRSSDMDLPDYYFYDSNAKVNLDLTDKTTLTLAGYWGNDDLGWNFGPDDSRLDLGMYWGNRTFSSRLRHALGRYSYITFGGAISRYRSQFLITNEGVLIDKFRERISDYSLKSDYEYYGFKNHQVRTGTWFSLYDIHFYEQNEDITYVDIDTSTFNIAVYAQDTWRVNAFVEMQPGVRVYYHEDGNHTAIDPRLSMVYYLNTSMRFKAAVGRYTQWVNVMSGGADFNVFDLWFPVDGSIEPSYTNQVILGYEWDRPDGYEFTTEAYYTDMHNIASFRPMVDSGEKTADAFAIGDGYAYGFEWMVRKKAGRLNGWIGYSLSWVKRHFPPESNINEGKWFFPKWDRRHDFVAVANYKLSRRWDISASWRHNTGQGYTQGLGIRTLQIGSIDPAYMWNDGRDVYQGSMNNYRLPADHRLDLSATWNHLFFMKRAKLIISIFNAYNHRSYWMRFIDESEEPAKVVDVKLLPIIPMVSYEVRF